MFRIDENEQKPTGKELLYVAYLFLVLVCATILSASLAYAAGSSHSGGFSDTLPYWPNFIVFLAIFIYLLRPPFKKFWAERRASIEKAVTKGERELKAAMQELEAAQSALASVPDEIAKMKSSIKSETEREYDKILEEASKRAERIAQQAGDSIEAERKAAEVEIRRELAERVVEQARQRLKGEINASYDEKLRQSAFKGMSNLVQ